MVGVLKFTIGKRKSSPACEGEGGGVDAAVRVAVVAAGPTTPRDERERRGLK